MSLGFHKAATTYHEHAWVQAQIAQELFQQIFPLTQHQTQIIEFGAGTGHLSQYLFNYPALATLKITDLSAEMLEVHQELWQTNSALKLNYECVDVRQMSTPSDPCLLISSATVQWLDNLIPWLQSLHQVLSPGSQIAFSFFGPQNLCEFYRSYFLTFGLYFPIPITLWDAEKLGEQCALQGWTIQHLSCAQIIQKEKDLWTLLRHFKNTGVHSIKPSIPLSKSHLSQWQDQYDKCFGDVNDIPCTWDYGIICLQKS